MFAHELFRKRIKLKHILIILGCTVFLACVMGTISYSFVHQDRIKNPLDKPAAIITGVEAVLLKENCRNNPVLYTTSRNSNVYMYCLENLLVTMDDESCLELKEYLLLEENGLDIITVNYTRKLEWPDNFNRPGNNLFSGADFNILKCYTENNKDIYIGDKSLDYSLNFCE